MDCTIMRINEKVLDYIDVFGCSRFYAGAVFLLHCRSCFAFCFIYAANGV